MSILELFLIALGLSMDAFAVAVSIGLTMKKITLKKALIVGIYFGIFQAGMPLIGYVLGMRFADTIMAFDHWITFALLSFIGAKMIVESFKQEGRSDGKCPVETCMDRECPGGERLYVQEASLKLAPMLPLALATSIDALAVGVPFAFLKVDIMPAVFFIGTTTLVLSMAGVKIGKVFMARFKGKAELAGGVILVLMGVKILLEHMELVNI